MMDIYQEALCLLDGGGTRFQVNPSTYHDRCGGLGLSTDAYRFDDISHGIMKLGLLTELCKDDYTSFVVAENSGYFGIHIFHEVRVTNSEWEKIISPLVRPLCFAPEFAAFCERAALAISGATFEQIVGSKAGTGRDVGGREGNLIIADNRKNISMRKFDRIVNGQQDCFDEARTVKWFLDIIIRHGLIVFHEQCYDIGLPIDELVDTSTHVAACLLERAIGEPVEWAVDSWPYGNGKPFDIRPREEWTFYWLKRIAPHRMESWRK